MSPRGIPRRRLGQLLAQSPTEARNFATRRASESNKDANTSAQNLHSTRCKQLNFLNTPSHPSSGPRKSVRYRVEAWRLYRGAASNVANDIAVGHLTGQLPQTLLCRSLALGAVHAHDHG